MDTQRIWYTLLMSMLADASRARLDGDNERAKQLEDAQQQMKNAGEIAGYDTVEACKDVLTTMAERKGL